jgi:hypothetical protein
MLSYLSRSPQEQEYEIAQHLHRVALGLKKNHLPAMAGLGELLLLHHGKSHFDEASLLLERVARLEPAMTNAQYCFGLLYLRWATEPPQVEAAMAVFEEAFRREEVPSSRNGQLYSFAAGLAATCLALVTQNAVCRRDALKSVTRWHSCEATDEHKHHDVLSLEFALSQLDLGPSPNPESLDQRLFLSSLESLTFGLGAALPEGLVLEFGVRNGFSVRHLATLAETVHGFDSFEGDETLDAHTRIHTHTHTHTHKHTHT